MTRARLAALPLVWVLGATTALASCSTQSPETRLQAKLDAITSAANGRDADGVRNAVEAFLDEVAAQSRDGMPSSRVKKLRDLAALVRADADLIDERLTEAEASASAQAEASRAAAAATKSAEAAASRSAAAEASRSAAAEAEASRSAAAASASASAEPTDDDGVVPTLPGNGNGNGKKDPSPTPTP